MFLANFLSIKHSIEWGLVWSGLMTKVILPSKSVDMSWPLGSPGEQENLTANNPAPASFFLISQTAHLQAVNVRPILSFPCWDSTRVFCGKPGSLLPLCPGLVCVVGCHREGTQWVTLETLFAIGNQKCGGIDFLCCLVGIKYLLSQVMGQIQVGGLCFKWTTHHRVIEFPRGGKSKNFWGNTRSDNL